MTPSASNEKNQKMRKKKSGLAFVRKPFREFGVQLYQVLEQILLLYLLGQRLKRYKKKVPLFPLILAP